MRRILHVVPGLNEGDNGIAVAAKLIAAEQAKSGDEAEVIDTRGFVSSFVQPSTFDLRPLSAYAEIWVHSMWLPMTLRACWKVIRAGAPLVRMTHANLDLLRYRYHGWKKRLVAPIERWLFKHTDRVVVTCEAEKGWCRQWGLKNEFEILDLKKFFDLDKAKSKSEVEVEQRNLHVLYLGRRHQLKGVEFLERAVEELKQTFEHSEHSNNRTLELRIVSNAFGEEKEKVWQWCDVLVLPTLSENFGLVVAEALERGKSVITTDGAPVWEGQPGVIYLKGYRNGTAADRVRLLKDAIVKIANG